MDEELFDEMSGEQLESRCSDDHDAKASNLQLVTTNTPNSVTSGSNENSQRKDVFSGPPHRVHWKAIRNLANIRSVFGRDSDRPKMSRKDSFIDRFTNRRPGDEPVMGSLANPSNIADNIFSPDSKSLARMDSTNQTDRTSVNDRFSSNIEHIFCENNNNTGGERRSVDTCDAFPSSLIPDQAKLRKLGEKTCGLPFIFQPHSFGFLLWLSAVSFAVLYNLWLPIARQAFKQLHSYNYLIFLTLDLAADIIYLMDFVVQLGTTYLDYGLVVINRSKLAKHYVQSAEFRMDLISIVPLDLLQIKFGQQPMLRFPRFVKIYRAQVWKVKIENRSLFPNLWRVINSIHVLFLGCHWFACIYFMISQYENFESKWGYQPSNKSSVEDWGRAYLKCYYWATLALTTIGIESEPETNLEYGFTCISYLIGLFIFATIVGQVGNIINTRNASRIAFEKILDDVKSYMRMHGVRPDLQKRILRWYDYAWYKRRMDGVGDVNALTMLPDKLKSELAVNVNLATLKKVTIFKECRPEFLQDLVLKMRPHIFTPGDFVCRKGEIAREMFIIADGVLEVLGPDDEVISMMSSGDFFGEIGILNRDGANKRTADVRAVGYADLFALSRSDVLEALHDHPDAEILIKEFARKRLQANRQMQMKRSLNGKNPPYALLPMVSKSRRLLPPVKLDFDKPQEKSELEDVHGNAPVGETSIQPEAVRLQEVVNNFTERWQTLVHEFIQNYAQETKAIEEETRFLQH